MANNSANVSTGKPKVGGAVFRAPVGTKLPTDAISALDVAFKCLGYLSEDGLKTETTRDSDEVKSWEGDVVVQPQTDFKDTFSGTFIESLNAEVLKMVYGDENVTEDTEAGTITVKCNSKELPYMTYVIDLVLKNNAVKRIVFAEAKPTEIGETTYNSSDPIGYEITFGAIASPSLGGDTHVEYIKKAK